MAYATKDQINNHVVEVLTPHSHLCPFDFLALAALKKYHVILHLAGGSTDLRAVCGQGLEMHPMLGVCHIVGSQRDGVSLLPVACSAFFPIRMNNWSAAEPLGLLLVPTCTGCELTDQLAQIGLLLVPTCAAECGMDAWAHALRLPRCAETYLSLRMELSRFLLQHSDDPIWHNIWHCLGTADDDAAAENDGGDSGGHDGGDGGGSGARGSGDGVSRGRGVSRGLGVSRGSGTSTATPKSRSTVSAKAKATAKALGGLRSAVKGKGRGKATVSRSALGRGKGK